MDSLNERYERGQAMRSLMPQGDPSHCTRPGIDQLAQKAIGLLLTQKIINKQGRPQAQQHGKQHEGQGNFPEQAKTDAWSLGSHISTSRVERAVLKSGAERIVSATGRTGPVMRCR